MSDLDRFLFKVRAQVRGGLRIVGPDDGLAAFPEVLSREDWCAQYEADEQPVEEPRVIEPEPVDERLQRILDEGGLQIRKGRA